MTTGTPDDRIRRIHRGPAYFLVEDTHPTFWDRFEAGQWEPETLAWVDQAGPGTTFLDIGTWIGPLTLTAAARGAQVVGVEADPVALGILQASLAHNASLAERVTLLAGAAVARPGTVRLGARRKPGDSMSSLLLGDADGAWTAAGLTPAVIVGALPLDGPVMVKVDIEGGEYDLLPALAEALPAQVFTVVAAFHPGFAREAGIDEPTVRARTEACFAGFQGWHARILDEAGTNVPVVTACRRDATVCFSRHQAIASRDGGAR